MYSYVHTNQIYYLENIINPLSPYVILCSASMFLGLTSDMTISNVRLGSLLTRLARDMYYTYLIQELIKKILFNFVLSELIMGHLPSIYGIPLYAALLFVMSVALGRCSKKIIDSFRKEK